MSVPSGTVNAFGSPTVFTLPPIRDIRNIRVASRSRSRPTTYQRPCQDTIPHGSRVRMVGSEPPLRGCSNRTAVRLTTADQSGSKAGSEAPTCGSIALSADWSVWIPAAFSLSTAEVVASARLACCQTRAATPSTAASSGSRCTSGSSKTSRRIRYPTSSEKNLSMVPISIGMPRSRSSSLSRSNIFSKASSVCPAYPSTTSRIRSLVT